MDETLEGRIETLERAVTDGDHDLSTLAEEADALDRLAAAEDRIDELETRVEELDAASQALRGYVGNIRSVNTDIEQRADAALAKAEAVEDALADTEETAPRSGKEEPAGGPDNRTGDTTNGDHTADGNRASCHRTGQGGVGRDAPADMDPRTGTGQGRATVDAPTGPTHDAGTPDGGRSGIAARGGTRTEHCHACGRPHGTGAPDSDESGKTSGSASAPEDLVESGEEEPGTLERIREML